MARKRARTERGWWDLLNGNSQEVVEVKLWLDARREEIQGHVNAHGGLRKYLINLALDSKADRKIPGPIYEDLNQIHPDALSLISAHGIEYRPHIWVAPPPKEPEANRCYLNALSLMTGYNRVAKWTRNPKRLVHVEGVGICTKVVQHAWNSHSVTSDVAVDSSWYGMSPWCSYIGIPLTESEYWKARHLLHEQGLYLLMFSNFGFPKVRNYLSDVLLERFERTKKAA